jgi:hypothetical protein
VVDRSVKKISKGRRLSITPILAVCDPATEIIVAARRRRANLRGLFSHDFPVEIIDTQENIDAFLPILERMMRDGLITTHALKIVRVFTRVSCAQE